MKLIKSVIDKIESPLDRAQTFYRDKHLKGFALRVTHYGQKSFVIEKLIKGKVRRITLGRYGELTAEMARKEALKLLGKIATGIDPVAEKKHTNLQSITLKQAVQDYLNSRKSLKAKTLNDYRKVFELAFKNWRIIFKFEGQDAILIDYLDYH